jgi:hypothetical protein
MTDVSISQNGETFELTGGFGWNYIFSNPVPSFIPNVRRLNFWGGCKENPWQRLNWLVDLDKISYGGDDTKGDVDHSQMADV